MTLNFIIFIVPMKPKISAAALWALLFEEKELYET